MTIQSWIFTCEIKKMTLEVSQAPPASNHYGSTLIAIIRGLVDGTQSLPTAGSNLLFLAVDMNPNTRHESCLDAKIAILVHLIRHGLYLMTVRHVRAKYRRIRLLQDLAITCRFLCLQPAGHVSLTEKRL